MVFFLLFLSTFSFADSSYQTRIQVDDESGLVLLHFETKKTNYNRCPMRISKFLLQSPHNLLPHSPLPPAVLEIEASVAPGTICPRVLGPHYGNVTLAQAHSLPGLPKTDITIVINNEKVGLLKNRTEDIEWIGEP